MLKPMNHSDSPEIPLAATTTRRGFFFQAFGAVAAATALAASVSPEALLAGSINPITPTAMTTAVETAHQLSWQARCCMTELVNMQTGASPFTPGLAAELQSHIVECVQQLPAHLKLISSDPKLARRIAERLSGKGNPRVQQTIDEMLENGPKDFIDTFRRQAEEAQQTLTQIDERLEKPHAAEQERSWVEQVHGVGAATRLGREFEL